MYEFLSIILIVFGILQIILFFKVWGMTNDVKKIKEIAQEGDNSSWDTAKIETLAGNYEKAYEIYFKCFINDVYELTIVQPKSILMNIILKYSKC